MKKSPGSNRSKKTNTHVPLAFELAALASADGNLHKAFQSYLSASEYLEMNGPAELKLRKGTLSEKVKALDRLIRGGALKRGEAVIEYEKLVSGMTAFKLYKDKRDDGVKSAIKAVTERSCSYQTARDYLKKAWMLNPSLYTRPELWGKVEKAAKPWDHWCDANTVVGQDKEEGTGENYRYLWIPGELLEATLHLLRQRKK